jgi:hypothetical protein
VEFDSDDEMADRKRRIIDLEKNLDYLCESPKVINASSCM